MIEVKNIQKKYADNIVLDIPWIFIENGEILGIVGNNGAGKTTFFQLILDLVKADKGNINSGHLDVVKNEHWKKYTGSYLDESFMIDYLTPKEFFIFVGKVYNISETLVFERLDIFKKFFNNEILNKKKYIRQLSIGNRQKVGIAAAMLIEPKVLILDEPYSFLDPKSQFILKELITHYSQEFNSTILIASHNLEFVTGICSRIILLEKGKIIKDKPGTRELVYELEAYFRES